MNDAIVIGSVNQKGGQGKTQGIHFLCMVLNKMKKKILVIDFDPQAGQTTMFGLPENILEENNYADISLIYKKQIEAIVPMRISKRVDAILSDYKLGEVIENNIKNKENMLSKLVERFKEDYDYILIDSQPTIGTLMTSVILASDKLFVPIKTSYLDERATKSFFEELSSVIEAYNTSIEKICLVPNLYESGTKDGAASLSNIEDNYEHFLKNELGFQGEIVVTSPIPKRVVFGEGVSSTKYNNIIKYLEKKKDKSNKDLVEKLISITLEFEGSSHER